MARPESVLKPQDLGIGKLFENVRDAVIVAEAATGRIVLWNLAATEVFGYSPSEALDGLNVEALVPESLKERHRAGLSRYRDTGHGPYIDSYAVLDLPAVRKGGEEIRIEMTLSPTEPIPEAKAEGRFVLAVVRDVTERKREKEALKKSEDRFRSLMQNSSDIITVISADGTIVYQTPSMKRTLAHDPEDRIGKNIFTSPLIHPDDAAKQKSLIDQTIRNPGLEPVYEARLRHRDGSWRWVEGIITNLLDDPSVGGIVLNGRDITERKRVEEALRESEERFGSMIRNVSDVITVYDAEGTVRYVSPAIERMLGYEPEERIGSNSFELIHPDDVDRAKGAFVDALKKPNLPISIEVRVRHKDGSWRHVEAVGTNLLSDPSVRGIVLNSRDVTDRKRAEEALKESEERYRTISRELALLHRVRTALARELDLTGVLRALVEAVAEAYGYTQVSAYLLEGGQEAVLQHQVGYDRQIERLPVERGVMGRVARTGKPVLLEDVGHDPDFLGAIEGIVSEVCVPLFDGGEIVGLLNVESTQGVKLTQEDLRLMVAVCEHASVSVSRARLHARLRRSEEYFRSLVQNSSDVITVIGTDGTILYDSPAVERVLGYKPMERVGTNAFDHVRPEDLEQGTRVFEEVMASPGAHLTHEFRWPRKDGSVLHLEVSLTNLVDDPAVGGIVANWRDITGRKEAEEALRHSEERFRSLVQNASDIVLVTESGGAVRYVSPAVKLVLGYEPEDVIGKDNFSVVHPDDMPRVRDLIAGMIGMPGAASSMELRLRHADGSWRWVETTCTNLLDDPAVGGIVFNSRDMTERKEAEEALKESEERFRSTFEEAAVGMAVSGLDGGFLQVNRSLCEMLGYSEEELLATTFLAITHPDDLGADLDHMRRMLEGEIDSFRTEKRCLHADGHPVWVSLNASVVRDSAGEPLYFIAQAQDITDRKEVEEERARRARHAALRADVSAALAEGGTLPSVLQRCAECMVRHLDAAFVRIWTLNEGEDVLELRASAGMYTHLDGPHGRVPVGKFKIGLIAQEKLPHLTNDVLGDPRISDMEWAEREGMKAFAGYPLIVEGRVVGVMAMFARQALGEDAIEALASVADALAQGIERKRAEEALKESERRYRSVVDNIKEVIFQTDARGLWTFLNPAWQEITGFSVKESVGTNFLNYIHPDDRQRNLELFRPLVEREKDHCRHEIRYLTKDGGCRWIEVWARLTLSDDGTIIGTSGTLNDITERKRAEEALEESERYLRTVVGNVPVVLFALDREGVFTLSEGKGLQALGLRPGELIGRSVFELYREVPQIAENVRRTLGGEEVVATVEVGEGVFETFYSPLLDEDGEEVVGVIGVAADVTERQALEGRLRHQAYHDTLTGLPNRRLFVDRLGQALRRTRRRQGRMAAVLFVDLDGFKVVNDSLGHEAGDRLLVAVAECLRGCVRPEDTLARFGGDEFAVLVEDVEGPEDAARVTRRLMEGLREPFVVDGKELFVGASVGVALGSARTKSPEDLLRDADTAMYRAKEEGTGCRVFDPAMYERVLDRLGLENDIRRAVRAEEFVVHYQPIVSLIDGEVRRVEALVRWKHPKRGLLDPAEFMPLAEETGLIVPVGEGVLEEACRQGQQWREKQPEIPPLMISVNLSARQLGHPDLAKSVEGILRETGFEARLLSLDVTETVYIKALEGNTAALDRLKRLGVSISIDDFGVGYSSLAYLKRLPADVLKIDRSFVTGIGEDVEDTAIVGMIVDLAHALGMEVVAEGVESADQAEQLQEMGCDMGQGFFFSEALPPEAFPGFLAR
jgi:diguanylate cyclase (GGDEF)-like protein/PAS domain S-box-containing protein